MPMATRSERMRNWALPLKGIKDTLIATAGKVQQLTEASVKYVKRGDGRKHNVCRQHAEVL